MLLFFCHSHFLIYFHVRLDGFFFSVFPETNHTKQFSTKTSLIRDFRIFDPCIKENKFLAVVGLPCEFQWEPFSLVEGLFMFKYEYVCFLGSREQIQFSSPSFSLSFSISSNSSLMCWMKEETRWQLEAFAGHLRGWWVFDKLLRWKSHFSFVDLLRS